MKKTLFVLLTTCCVNVLSASPSFAALMVFTDRTAWENAIIGLIIDDPFDNSPISAPTLIFDSGVVSTVANPSQPHSIESGVFQTGVGFGTDITTWVFPNETFGFGGDFSQVNINDGLEVIGNFNGTGDLVVSISGALAGSTSGFVGIVGMSSFSEIIWNAQGPDFWQIDNLAFSAAVPVPASWLILGLGLAVLRMRRRDLLRI